MRSVSSTSLHRARAGGDADRLLEPDGRGRVARPRRRVDAGDTHRPGGLGGRVVHLVGEAPARQVDGRALATGGADGAGDVSHRLVPRDPVEPAVAAAAAHRMGEAAELAEVVGGQVAQPRDIAEDGVVERLGAVQLEQPQAGRAQVDAVQRPVVEPGDAQRAAVAHPLGEDRPRLAGVALHTPGDLGHLAVVVGLLVADPVRRQADPVPWKFHRGRVLRACRARSPAALLRSPDLQCDGGMLSRRRGSRRGRPCRRPAGRAGRCGGRGRRPGRRPSSGRRARRRARRCSRSRPRRLR